ncbi:MAG: fumarate hydratase C-terminal domain-containing protein, partial [Ruminococcus sp.]|nr:fumarate hydratase C-terminal domain-containing protein [Ruminococcus sp.]
MAEVYYVNSQELKKRACEFRCGDKIFLTGTVYTSRDAAHKRINSLLDNNSELPFDLTDAVIYYAGPTPAPEGKAIGSCGPTTS